MQSRRILVPVLITSLLLGGCWDRREINDVAFVLSTGIDLVRTEKGERLYHLSMQIPLPSQLGGSGSSGGGGGTSGGSGKPWYIETGTGPSIREANQIAQKGLSRELIFSHRRVLLIGEAMARDGVASVVDLLGRIPQNRLSTYLFVTHGPAQALLNVDAPIEQTPAEMARELAVASMKEPRTLKDLVYTMLLDGIDPFLPSLLVGRTPPGPEGKSLTTIRMDGMAVFVENRLVGFLDTQAHMGALWAMGQAKTPTVTVQVPDGTGRTTVQFHENVASIEPVIQGSQITMRIQIRAKGTIVENNSGYSWTVGTRMRTLEGLVAAKIAADIQSAVNQLQALRSDVLGFGHLIHVRHPGLWREMGPRWRERFPTVKVAVAVTPHIESSGTLTAPFGYPKSPVLR